MPTVNEDKRVVIVSVTTTEINNLLGAKAKQAGVIDFDPDKISIVVSPTSGMAFDITFEKEL